MAKKTQKTSAKNWSTQKFIEVKDIKENIVLLENGNACLVMQVTAVNFALLSREEQNAKVYAYAALLNSLSFPIQIVIRSKRIDILPYVKLLEAEAQKTTNALLATSIRQYKDFVENLVKMTTVLDKNFYLIIPYTSLEAGVRNTATVVGMKNASLEDLFIRAKTSLHTKAESLLGQIERLSLHARILDTNQLIRLFYESFNQGSLPLGQEIDQATNTLAVSGTKKT